MRMITESHSRCNNPPAPSHRVIDSRHTTRRFEIRPVLAGMGEVYRARDTKINRDVALKILTDAFATERP